MGYWIQSFDSLAIPTALGSSGSMDLTLAERASPLVTLPGGVYDPLGSDWAPRRQSRLTAKVLLVAASAAALRTALDGWLAKVGKAGLLSRSDGSNTQTVTARLVDAPVSRQIDNVLHLSISLVFDVLSPVWSGAAHADTTALNASPKAVTVANGGNARVTDPIITITAAGTAITLVQIYQTGVASELNWSGSIAAGKSLVIDCGSLSVLNDGTAAYSGFGFGAAHKISDWLRLEPGNNTVNVQKTGGGTASTVKFEYADGWA